MKDLREAYQLMQDNCGIKVGDTVRVLRISTKKEEKTYGATWVTQTTKFIGKEYLVEGMYNGAVILAGVRFPFFVLEKIKDAEPELKPCPFCGEKPELLPSEALNAKWHNQFTVCCSINANGCGSTSRYADSKQEAIKAWNKRVSV